MLRLVLSSVLITFLLGSNAQADLEKVTIPIEYQQVILVTPMNWDDSVAILQRYERTTSEWTKVGKPITVMIGRSGLTWGRGLHEIRGMEKVEGDGRAPAGIFELSGIFGYSSTAPRGCKLPYRQATERDFWIDDVNSPQYNQWVKLPAGSTTPEDKWASFERMKRPDQLYELGVVVDHNTSPVTTGKGSAIFMHVWKGKGKPTAGCTAMPKRKLKQVVQWLDPLKKPLLIQIPAGDIDQLVFQ